MQKKKIDFRKYLEKIEPSKNTVFMDENIRKEILKIGKDYQLQEGFWIQQITPFYWRWNLEGQIERISDEEFRRIIIEAKKEWNEGNELPLEFQSDTDIDQLLERCRQLIDERDKLRDKYHKISGSWLAEQKWFQELETKEKRLHNLVEKEKPINWELHTDEILSSINSDLQKRINVNTITEIAGITRLIEEIGRMAQIKAFPKINYELCELEKKIDRVSDWLDDLYRSYFDVSNEVFLIKSRNEEIEEEVVQGICEKNLKLTLVKAEIPLNEQNWQTWCGGGGESNPPTIYGFEFSNKKTGFYCNLNISYIAIMLRFDKSDMDIWWVWPKKQEHQLSLLRKLKTQMEKLGICFPKESIHSLFQKNLILTGLDRKMFETPPINNDKIESEKDIDFTQEEANRVKESFGGVIYKPRKGDYSGPNFNKYYFKRLSSKSMIKKETKNKLSREYYGIQMINAKLYKSQYVDEICFCIVFNDNLGNVDEELGLIYNKNFNDVLSILKLFDKTMKQLQFLAHDQIIENSTIPSKLDLNIEIEKRFCEASNEYFLLHEIFQFEEESTLEEISARTMFRGTDWGKYVEQYKMHKNGKTQDEIAQKYQTSQQTISNHINKVEFELTVLAREAYGKWLDERHSVSDNVIKVERNETIGKPDLVVYMRDNYVEIIKIEVSNFKPSKPLYTIPMDEFLPEVKKSKELEKRGYKVNLLVDFYNLFNGKRYQRKSIDFQLPPDYISYKYKDEKLD